MSNGLCCPDCTSDNVQTRGQFSRSIPDLDPDAEPGTSTYQGWESFACRDCHCTFAIRKE